MPFKHNAAHRHRIGKMKFKVTNWAEYESGLRRRGSLTLWVTAEALSSWQAPKRTTRGGQPRYSDLAIETALTLGLAFSLRLRQTEGLLVSVADADGTGSRRRVVETGAVAAFLASSDSTSMTGSEVFVYGGMRASEIDEALAGLSTSVTFELENASA
jgi:hypothetical protein